MREYWIIEWPRGDQIDFQILQLRQTRVRRRPHKDGWHRSRVFGRSFQLSRSRIAAGGWRYKLAVKAA